VVVSSLEESSIKADAREVVKAAHKSSTPHRAVDRGVVELQFVAAIVNNDLPVIGAGYPLFTLNFVTPRAYPWRRDHMKNGVLA